MLPYFGKLPNYFELWLYSAGQNSTIDFLLITDASLSAYQVPENVLVKQMTFAEMQNLVQSKLGSGVSIEKPYKLCDYKPAYGEVFGNDLNGYDFWGWVDPDMIFGDLRKFLTEELLAQFDKIKKYGHLVLIRNEKQFNEFYRQSELAKDHPGVTCQDAFYTKANVHFDESYFMNVLWDEVMPRTYYKEGIEFADIEPNQFELIATDHFGKGVEGVYHFVNGRLYRVFKGGVVEVACIHLLKRTMRVMPEINLNNFWITGASFISSDDANFSENYLPSKEELAIFDERKKINIKRHKKNRYNLTKLIIKMKKIYREKRSHRKELNGTHEGYKKI
ncbi:MAG: hypothetical protein LBS33_06900 [Streptococcaceae bacterium]|nr:hypothetical protein [Streptococcaceae bacterium]